MTCLNPKPVKYYYYRKIDDKTGEIYPTKGIKFKNLWDNVDEYTDFIPCGTCAGCRVDKANDNATKAYLESQNWPKNAFLTLTYDNMHLPEKKSLRKRDLQLFWKKLRKHIAPQRIKYLACGEYGPTTKRPHYHAAVFNYWPSDCKIYKTNDLGDYLFTSDELNKIWGNGYVIVGNLTYESAAYIARYVQKKAYGLQHTSIKPSKQPEFTTCSKRPALAKNFYTEPEKWDKIKRNNGVWVQTKAGAILKRIPTSLRNYFKHNERVNFFIWSEKNRQKNKTNIAQVLKHTDLTIGHYLKNKSEDKKNKLKRLDKFRNNNVNLT